MQGKRISLIKPCVEHTECMVETYTNLKIREFLGGPLNEEEAKIRVKDLIDQPPDYYWSVVNRSNSFMGAVSVHKHHDSEDLEISYLFLPEFWGNGYAYESIQIVLDFLFNDIGLIRVLAETQSKNLKSIKLLKKLGFYKIKSLERFGESQSLFEIKV